MLLPVLIHVTGGGTGFIRHATCDREFAAGGIADRAIRARSDGAVAELTSRVLFAEDFALPPRRTRATSAFLRRLCPAQLLPFARGSPMGPGVIAGCPGFQNSS
jgi:hypothetical protein